MAALLVCCFRRVVSFFFFFNDTATTEIYPLSLHDALPISRRPRAPSARARCCCRLSPAPPNRREARDRKSTRLNSSHGYISYAVFCLKKKKKNKTYVNTKPKEAEEPMLPTQ